MTPEAKKALLDHALDAMALDAQHDQMMLGLLGASSSAFGSARHHLHQLANQANLQGVLNGGYRQASTTLPGYPSYAPYFSPGAFGFSPAAQQALAALGAQPFAPSPPEPIEDAGIRPGEVRAYRCWRVQQGFLHSMSAEDVWAPGEPMIGKPTETGYGVHAWKSMSKALTYAMTCSGGTIVVGQVELWGDIVEHEHGYRAENAAIVSLDGILGGKAPMLHALRQRYGVDGPEVGVPDWTDVEWARELVGVEPNYLTRWFAARAWSIPVVSFVGVFTFAGLLYAGLFLAFS